MRWWKIVGLAGLAGVVATGAVTARAERQRRAYTPDEIRSRLHERMEQAHAEEPTPAS
jgi:glutamate dehydrogenase/leucine dehydrogenase